MHFDGSKWSEVKTPGQLNLDALSNLYERAREWEPLAGVLEVLCAAQTDKTKLLADKLKGMGLQSVLVITDGLDENLWLASRNLPKVDLLPVAGLNVYDILRRDTLVLTKAAVAAIETR